MTISSVNLGYLAQFANSWGAYNQKLTNETKAKLEKYGIAYNQNITEAEAKALVLAYEKAQETKKSTSQDSTDGKDNLFERAKQLAQKLGIQVQENANFSELLTKIEEAINTKSIENRGDKKALEQLKAMSLELSSIQAESVGSMGFNASINKTLMDSLEMLSEYNKNFLY